MRVARFARVEGGADPAYGIVDGDPGEELVLVLDGDPLVGNVRPTGEQVRLVDVRLLAPVIPRSKVVCVGKNYADHAAEMGGEAPTEPLLFLKPNTSVIGPLEAIVLPEQSREVHHEAELAVVIGRLCKDVPRERVADVVLGYTCANDVTARDLQKADGQWARAKGFDTFCPLGPWIETDLDTSDLAVTATVDGDVRQSGRTSQMIHSVADVVMHASAAMTLLPGDVILTGTPAGVGPIHDGESVSVTIEGIGTLTNRVVRRG